MIQKQLFLRAATLCIAWGAWLSLSYGQARGVEQKTFNFECETIGELADVTFDANKIAIHRDFEPHVQFVAPEWQNGRDEQYPVGYQAGATPKLSAKFQITCPKTLATPNATVKIQGTCSDGTVLAEEVCNVVNGFATYSFTSIKTRTAGMVDYVEHLTTTWQIKDGNGDWKPAGKSDNKLYVPLSKTIKGCNIADAETKVFYSTLHYSCNKANGMTDLSQIANAIYTNFQTLHLPRIDNPTQSGQAGMKYWGGINPLTGFCRGLKGLLNFEDAACGEWRRFLQHCYAQHDIQGCWGLIEAKTPPVSIQQNWFDDFSKTFKSDPLAFSPEVVFLVKSWNLPQLNKFYVVSKKWPYTNMQAAFSAPNGETIEVGDKLGDLAQNMIDPEPFFSNHGTVCLNGKIYDPSYGAGPFDSITEWETNSVDAYAIHSTLLNNQNERVHIVYPYELEQPQIQQINYLCK